MAGRKVGNTIYSLIYSISAESLFERAFNRQNNLFYISDLLKQASKSHFTKGSDIKTVENRLFLRKSARNSNTIDPNNLEK